MSWSTCLCALVARRFDAHLLRRPKRPVRRRLGDGRLLDPRRGRQAASAHTVDLAGGDADWSPDGKLIVFSTYPLVYFQETGVSNLYTIRPDGSDLRRLTSYDEGETRASQPRWTPDGKHIIYVADTGGARELWLMDADGSHRVQITEGGIYTHPVWQPSTPSEG